MQYKFIKIGLAWGMLMFLSNIAWTQLPDEKFDILFGEQRRVSSKETHEMIMGSDNEGMYTLSQVGNDILLFNFGNDMQLRKQNTVRLRFQKHNLKFQYAVQLGDQIYVLTTFTSRKDKEVLLFSHKLNTDLLTLSTPKLLSVYSYDGYSSVQIPTFSFTVSEHSKTLLCKVKLPYSNSNYLRIGLLSLNQEMDVLWELPELFKDEKKLRFENIEMQVTDEGKVFLMMKIYDLSREFRQVDINYSFEIWRFDSNTVSTHKEFDVSIIGQHVSDIKFVTLDDGSLQVIGFFGSELYEQNGIFKINYDSSFNIVDEFSLEFPFEFIVQFDSKKERHRIQNNKLKKKELAFDSYVIDDIVKNMDGTLTLIGERYSKYQTVSTDANSGTTFTNHYEYGHILIIKFELEMGVEWMELIPKDQYTINDGGYYSGYSGAVLSNGNMVLVFNDEPKNNYLKSTGKLYKWNGSKRKADIIMYEIQPEGRIERFTLFNAADEDVLSRPSGAKLINNDQFIIMGSSRNNTTFIKLTFD
jgi:hypothetical protein